MDEVEERYRAFAGKDVDPDVRQPGYTIDIHFLGGLTERQKGFFKGAARRWSRVITGDLPDVTVDGRRIDDILIYAKGERKDGTGGTLASAGPRTLRRGSLLTATGSMSFDTADLPAMERRGTLEDVIVHEMGHCIGVGTLWDNKGLVRGKGTNNPTFAGAAAMREYGQMIGRGPTAVPVENTGGVGTRDSHWRERVFGNEMMTGYISSPGNPISRLTVASLQDLGYTVNIDNAEPYAVPRAAIEIEAREDEVWEIIPTEFEILPEEAFVDA